VPEFVRRRREKHTGLWKGGDLGIDVRIILSWIFERHDGRIGGY